MALPALAPPVVTHRPAYDSYLSGNPQNAAVSIRPGFFLMGGGTDVDDGFRWLLDHAGGGDVVVLRASGSDGYNDYIQELGPVDSVESIVLKEREASRDPYVLERVRQADGIFFAGGDQAKYFQLIENSPLAQELNQAIGRGVPIGGTSAGLAILGDIAFSARQGGIDSDEALQNPSSPAITLEPSFLRIPQLQGVLTDTHFSQRERLGRLLTFMNNQSQAGDPVKGVGVDEATAVLLEGDGKGRVVGSHKAVFVTGPATGAAEPTFQVQNVPAGSSVDLATWGAADIPRQRYLIRDHHLIGP